MRKILTAALAAFILSACASLTEGNTDAKLITQYAVIKVAQGDPEKAARIEEIATEVKRYASGEAFLTVDLLIAAIRDQVRFDRLDAADTLLVNALLDKLRAELVDRFGEEPLPEDLQLAVDVVSGWVIQASRMI